MLRDSTQAFYIPILITMAAILLFGFALFVTNLTETPLWSDEGWTIAASAESNPAEIITEWAAVDVHPPLFFIGLRGWRIFTGDSIFELRYYSVLLSLIAVAVVFRLGKALFNERVGLLAALLYALHDLVNVLTQEVRHYPQQMLLVMLVMWMYWRFYRQPSRNNGVVLALAGAALLYTHYWGGLILLALAIHAMLTRRHNLLPFIYVFLAIALLFVPWIPSLIHQITMERPGGLPHALENSVWVYRVLLYQLVGIPEVLWLILAGIGAMGAYAATPLKWRPSSSSLLVLLAAVLPPVLSVMVNAVYPTLSFRSLAVIVPVVIVLAAHGLSQFRQREQAVLVVFITIFALTSTSANPIDRPPWPEIADHIIARSDDSDVVLLENDTDEHTLVYYMEQTAISVDYAYTQSTREFHPEDYQHYLENALDGKNGVWVSKLDWPQAGDIRSQLTQMGFVESAPQVDYGIYNNRPILLSRYDRLPEGEPRAVFDDILRLLRAESVNNPGSVTVNLLWSPADVAQHDYTVSVFLLGAGVGNDSYPMDGASLTSMWETGKPYFDSRTISTTDLPPGTYPVGVKIYYFTDASFTQFENTQTNDCNDDANCQYIIIGEAVIE